MPPRITKDRTPDRDDERALKLKEFAAGFRPSKPKPDNLTRMFRGETLSVFQKAPGVWGWGRFGTGGERTWCRGTWAEREEALADLADELQVLD